MSEINDLIRYRRSLNGAYMLLPGTNERETFRHRMILENEIPHFLSVTKMEGEEVYYQYEISSKISLEEYLQHTPLCQEVCKQLIYTLCRSVETLEEYMLTEESLLLLPETIYIEENSQENSQVFYFCLYPDGGRNTREDLQKLLKYLMDHTEVSEEGRDDSPQILYTLYDCTLKDNFCIREFLQAMETETQRRQEAKTEYPEEKKKEMSQSEAAAKRYPWKTGRQKRKYLHTFLSHFMETLLVISLFVL